MSLPAADKSEESRFPLAILAGVGVMLLLLAGFYLLNRGSGTANPAAVPALPFGDDERAYAQQIHFTNPQMSRAANLLNQEVTFIVGTVENSGVRTVRQIDVSVEFQDLINQVVLRETHRLLPKGTKLGPGQHQDFQLNFENVPQDWNRRYPSLKITGLELE